jgi:hypothetical protein
MEVVVVRENTTMKTHDTPTPQADDDSPEADFTEAELDLNSVPVNVGEFLDKTTCEEISVPSASPPMKIDESEVEPAFSAQVKATYDCSGRFNHNTALFGNNS